MSRTAMPLRARTGNRARVPGPKLGRVHVPGSPRGAGRPRIAAGRLRWGLPLALLAMLGLAACQDAADSTRLAAGPEPRAAVTAPPATTPESAPETAAEARSRLRCQAIAGGESQVEVHGDNCPTCAAEAPEQAADADLDTFATLAATGSIGPTGIALRAVAQPGVVFPAGSQPGVFFRRSNGSLDNSDTRLTLRTYLEGALQEAPDDFGLVGTLGGNPWSFKFFEASAPFDAVEVHLGGMPVARFDLHEICADGEA